MRASRWYNHEPCGSDIPVRPGCDGGRGRPRDKELTGVRLVCLGMLIPISALGLPIVFWLIKRSAREAEPVRNGASFEFVLGRGLFLLLRLVELLLVAFTVMVFVAVVSTGGSLFAVLIALVVLAAILLATPRSVVVDDDGLRQSRWPLAERQTQWNEIATVSRDARIGGTLVWSTNRNLAAVFSPQLIGQQQFEKEIRARAQNVVFECDSDPL